MIVAQPNSFSPAVCTLRPPSPLMDGFFGETPREVVNYESNARDQMAVFALLQAELENVLLDLLKMRFSLLLLLDEAVTI